jgi:repressor LexA
METLTLTPRQQQVLDLIRHCRDRQLLTPTLREIADYLGIQHVNAAKSHVDALCRKGWLQRSQGMARSLRLTAQAQTQPSILLEGQGRPEECGADLTVSREAEGQGGRENNPAAAVLAVPILGTIPAGLADLRHQEADGVVHVDLDSLKIPRSSRMFALRVTGDSMIGKFILEGDIVVLEQNAEPRPGDVVAAFIDGQSTLKTFVLDRGRPCLRAENPRYPNRLVPLNELMIQGVMRLLIRPFDRGR